METTPSTKFPTFSGEPADFRAWMDTVYALAKVATSLANEALVTIMSQDEVVEAELDDFVHIQHPGDPPDDAANYPRWQYADMKYHKNEQELNLFSSKITTSLSPAVKSRVQGADPFHTLTLSEIFQRLRLHYQTVQGSDISKAWTTLKQKFVPGAPLRTFLDVHRRSHTHFDEQLQSIPECLKVEFLRDAIASEPAFTLTLRVFDETHQELATRTFNALELALLRHEADPIVVHSFASQATASALPPTKYCWSHGIGYHTGQECKTPKEGHLSHATAGNKLNGSTALAQTSTRFRNNGPTKIRK